jgi:hypothetical protein
MPEDVLAPPNLPCAWDREIQRLRRRGIGPEALAQGLGGTAAGLFGVG